MLTTTSSELIRLRFKARQLQKTKKAVINAFSGNIRTRKRGHGIEFFQARPYAYGDDVRNIDWRITARKTVVHTREFQQDHEQNSFLLVDQSLPMRFATSNKLKSVQAAHVAAMLGWSSIENKNRVGAMICGSQKCFLKPTLNVKKFCYWLGNLAQSTQELAQNPAPKPANWHEGITQILQLISPGTHVIIIGDLLYLNGQNIDILMHASKHHQITGIHVYDQFEQKIPKLTKTSFTDGTREYNFSSINKVQQQAYTQRIHTLERRFKRFGGQFITCATNEDIEPILKSPIFL